MTGQSGLEWLRTTIEGDKASAERREGPSAWWDDDTIARCEAELALIKDCECQIVWHQNDPNQLWEPKLFSRMTFEDMRKLAALMNEVADVAERARRYANQSDRELLDGGGESGHG